MVHLQGYGACDAFTRIKVNFERKKTHIQTIEELPVQCSNLFIEKKIQEKKQKEKIERKVKTNLRNGC